VHAWHADMATLGESFDDMAKLGLGRWASCEKAGAGEGFWTHL